MNKLFKYLILVCPIIIIVDFKFALTSNINIGLKEAIFFLIGCYLLNYKTVLLIINNRFIKWVIFFFLCILINNFLLNNIKNATIPLLRSFEGVIILIGIVKFLRLYSISTLYQSIVMSAIVLAIQILVTTLTSFEIDKALGGIAGLWLSIGTFILYYNRHQIKWNSKLISSIILFLILCNFISDRRTWVLITLVLLIIDYLLTMNKGKLILAYTSFSIGFLYVLLISNPITKSERISELYHAIIQGDIFLVNSLSSRMVRWKNVWEILMDKWFLGVGYDNIELGLSSWVKASHPDNQYLELWLQNGILALISFLVILYFGVFKLSFKKKPEVKSIKFIFYLLVIGGITWGYLNGYGILVIFYFFGITAYYFEKNQLIYKN